MSINIGVIGGYKCSRKTYKIAYSLGRLIAKEGWFLICGGGSGIMEAVCKGVREEGGLSCGLLPSYDGREANPYLDIRIPTGLGYARNILVVRASDILVAIDGKYGTLSEIAFALNEGKTVLGINTWKIGGVIRVSSPQQAIRKIKQLLKK